jgi:hypothetical protein
LEDAAQNRRPIARGEQYRGAVAAIQSALADLNRGYLLEAEVDGYFGSRTYAAVEAFQRDYGLAADGMVGRQTMSQLDTLYSSDVVRQPRGMSIHVGLNRVDPGHYGDEFELASCVNDARKMCDIAEGIGYETVTLEDDQATTSAFTGFMRSAISELYTGDSLLVTFSGHGSQIPNLSADAEADNLDETLCFYDRMFLDDEFYALLGQFRDGVRVHAVFDSCHSGTVAKDPFEQETSKSLEREKYKKKTLESLQSSDGATEKPKEVAPASKAVAAPGAAAPAGVAVGKPAPGDDRPIASKDLGKALDGDKPATADAPKPTKEKEANEDIASLFADLHADEEPTQKNIKQIEEAEWTRIYREKKDFYDAIQNVVGPQENQQLMCSVITLSACGDSQTTQAGRVYSLFTYNLASTWGGRGYDSSYQQFQDRLLSISRPDSTPEINTYGTNLATARLYDRPFMF